VSTVVEHDAPPSTTAEHGSRWLAAVGSLAFVVVGTLLQLPRQSGVEMWRTVWAEDGTRFYTDALARPWLDNVLESYAGYAHVVPRTLATIGVHLPTEQYSAFVALTAALSATLLALFVYFASAPLLRSPVRQAILSLAILFWPVLPLEITGSITNIQWAMPVACLFAVLLPVERPVAIAVRVPIVVLAPLSSPLCVLFLPIALWHGVRVFSRDRPPARLVIPFVYGMASALQLVVFATAPQYPGSRPPLRSVLPDIGRLYSAKVSTEFFFGVRMTENVWDAHGYRIAVVTLVVLAALILWRMWRATSTSRLVVASCVVGSAAMYFASVWPRSAGIGAMMQSSGSPFNFDGMRYELFPSALLLIALLVPLDLRPGAITEPTSATHRPIGEELRAQGFAIAVAAMWMLLAFVPSYRLDTARSGGPDWVTGVQDAEHACANEPTDAAAIAVPISPQPIWAVAVPCWELDRHY
jgi:hypothetical protein